MSVLKFTPNFEKENFFKIYKKYIILGIIAVILITLLLFYCFNSSFRNFITIYVFRKSVSQDNLTTITLNEDESSVKEKAQNAISNAIEGKTIVKEIYVKNKIYNIVVK